MNTLNYYTMEICGKIFNETDRPQWRIFKSIDIDGICRQNKRQITTPEKLYKFIHQCRNPQKLYVSISAFLSPQSNHGNFSQQKITLPDGYYYYPKAGYIYADCILLDSQFYIDCDYENDLSIAQDDARKIISFMETQDDFELNKILFSGTKGINLIFKQIKAKKVKHPIRRVKYYHNKKSRLADEIMKLGLKTIDQNHLNIMKDIFRVYALPYSIKPNGNIVTPLNLKDFMKKDIYDILRSKRSTRAFKRGNKPIEAKANDAKVAVKNMRVRDNSLGEGRDGLSTRRTYPYQYMCIANFVPGLNNYYVPFIKIYKNRLKHIDLKDLSRDISHMYIFEEKNHYWIIGLKFFKKDKLIRLMRKLKAVNQPELWRRYNKFRYTNIMNLDKKELEGPPKLVKTIKSDKIYKYSRAHYNFFNEFKVSDKLLCGKDTLKTYLAEVKS